MLTSYSLQAPAGQPGEPPLRGDTPAVGEAAPFGDMASQLAALQEALAAQGGPDAEWWVDRRPTNAAGAEVGVGAEVGAEVVVGRDVALELGHPAVPSEAGLVLTRDVEQIHDGRVRRYGPDLAELAALPRGSHVPFAQVVCLGLAPGDGEEEAEQEAEGGSGDSALDPYALEQHLRLDGRVRGWMARAVPGRLWVRVGVSALRRGLSLRAVGEALVRAYRSTSPQVQAVEGVLVTGSASAVTALAPVMAQARALAGRHKKLVLAPDGALECPDLDCRGCADREVCDALRDVIRKRRGGGAQRPMETPPEPTRAERRRTR